MESKTCTERSFSGVDSMVSLEIAFGQELGVTVGTVPAFDAFVSQDMKSELRSLSKSFAA